MKKMQTFIRQVVPKHVITTGFLLFIVGAFFTGGFFPFEMMEIEDSTLRNWWVSATIRDAGAILAAATIIVSGIRSIRSQGSNRRRVAVVLAGMGICIFFLALNSVANVQISKIIKSYDFSKMIALIEYKLRQDSLPKTKRTILMRKLAESRYLQSGERIVILTEDQEKEVFSPSEEMLRFKKNVDLSRQLYGLIKQWSHFSTHVWIAVLVLSTIAGALIPED